MVDRVSHGGQGESWGTVVQGVTGDRTGLVMMGGTGLVVMRCEVGKLAYH